MVSVFDEEHEAAGYDQEARESGWYAPEVIFGLAFEFIKPKQSLLDLGIGSGMSSGLFHKYGLKIHGLDGSPELLHICKQKGISTDLKQHDLHDLPLPYRDSFIDNAIAVGVLNFFKDPNPLIADVSRIMKRNGIFAFTVEDHKPGMDRQYMINRKEGTEFNTSENAINMYRHSREQIEEILINDGFQLLKSLEFLGYTYPIPQAEKEEEQETNIYFKAYVVRKL